MSRDATFEKLGLTTTSEPTAPTAPPTEPATPATRAAATTNALLAACVSSGVSYSLAAERHGPTAAVLTAPCGVAVRVTPLPHGSTEVSVVGGITRASEARQVARILDTLAVHGFVHGTTFPTHEEPA